MRYGTFSTTHASGMSASLGSEEHVSTTRLGLMFTVGDEFVAMDGTRVRIVGFEPGKSKGGTVFVRECGGSFATGDDDATCRFDGALREIESSNVPSIPRPRFLRGDVVGLRVQTVEGDSPTYRTATVVDVVERDRREIDSSKRSADDDAPPFTYAVQILRSETTSTSDEELSVVVEKRDLRLDDLAKFEIGARVRWIGTDNVAECQSGCEHAKLGRIIGINSDGTFDVVLGSSHRGTVYLDSDDRTHSAHLHKSGVLPSSLERSHTRDFYGVATISSRGDNNDTLTRLFCPKTLPGTIRGVTWTKRSAVIRKEEDPTNPFASWAADYVEEVTYVPRYDVEYGDGRSFILGYERGVGAFDRQMRSAYDDDVVDEDSAIEKGTRANTGFMRNGYGAAFDMITRALRSCFDRPKLSMPVCLAKLLAIISLEAVQDRLQSMSRLLFGVVDKLTWGGAKSVQNAKQFDGRHGIGTEHDVADRGSRESEQMR